MAKYKKLLLAVDLNPAHDDIAVSRAMEICKDQNAELFIVHAVEEIHAYGATQGFDLIVELQAKLANEANKLLSDLSSKIDLPQVQQILDQGTPKNVILEQAKKHNIDLIVVGIHGRHGIKALLGSTADGIIHYAPCDVLAVKVKD